MFLATPVGDLIQLLACFCGLLRLSTQERSHLKRQARQRFSQGRSTLRPLHRGQHRQFAPFPCLVPRFPNSFLEPQASSQLSASTNGSPRMEAPSISLLLSAILVDTQVIPCKLCAP